MAGLTIEIERKHYHGRGRQQGHTAIEGLSLELHSGEFVCLTGPSGCGKTTLLNIVAGIDRDFRGAIHVGGAHRRSDAVVSYMFQQPRLLPWRTLQQNIELVVGAEGWRGDWVQELVQIMELGDAVGRFPHQLSLGMQRRAALMRAFAVSPDVLLMDEPLVSLDELTAERIRQLLLSIWGRRPTTVLFVTHDLREAAQLADRLIAFGAPPCQVAYDHRIELPRDQRTEQFIAELRDGIRRQSGWGLPVRVA